MKNLKKGWIELGNINADILKEIETVRFCVSNDSTSAIIIDSVAVFAPTYKGCNITAAFKNGNANIKLVDGGGSIKLTKSALCFFDGATLSIGYSTIEIEDCYKVGFMMFVKEKYSVNDLSDHFESLAELHTVSGLIYLCHEGAVSNINYHIAMKYNLPRTRSHNDGVILLQPECKRRESVIARKETKRAASLDAMLKHNAAASFVDKFTKEQFIAKNPNAGDMIEYNQTARLGVYFSRLEIMEKKPTAWQMMNSNINSRHPQEQFTEKDMISTM